MNPFQLVMKEWLQERGFKCEEPEAGPGFRFLWLMAQSKGVSVIVRRADVEVGTVNGRLNYEMADPAFFDKLEASLSGSDADVFKK